MGIKGIVKKAAGKAADGVSKLSSLSPEQLDKVQSQRDEYLSQMPNPNDSTAEELTKRLLAASSVEIYKAYLAQLKELYVPIERQVEYGTDFDTARNIRFFNITKWVVDKCENSLEKLVNVYEVLSNEDSESASATHTEGTSTSKTDTSGSSDSTGGTAGANLGVEATANYEHSWNRSTASGTGTNMSDATTTGKTQSISESIASSTGKAIATSTGQAIAKATGTAVTSTVGRAVANTLGRAVSNSASRTAGAFQSVNFGANFGANFARSSNVTATIGKSEGINQTFTNYNIKHALEILEAQMKRLELSTALGMWDFAAYVMSEDQNVANNVAHSYIALTQGEESYMSQAAINLWRGDMGESSGDAKEICNYLRELRHPLFGLNPAITNENPDYNVYPPVVTATTNLSGKELAYSLNFPKKSISGLPVIECAEFGRNVVSYNLAPEQQTQIELGCVFHMNHEENAKVHLSKESLASHTFITGSTGSGKSNTVYQLLNEAMEQQKV